MHRVRIPPCLSAPDRERDAGGLSRTTILWGSAFGYADTSYTAQEEALRATVKRVLTAWPNAV